MESLPRRNRNSTNTDFGGGGVYYEADPFILISVLLETLSCGIFLALFLLSTVLLLKRRKVLLREKVVEPTKLRSLTFYLVMSVFMFLAITVKWAFWWAEILPIPSAKTSQGIVAQIPRLSRSANRVKDACIQIAVLLGDIITIYRLWILSNRNKVMIAFPVIGLLGFLACAIELSGRGSGISDTLIPVENGILQTSGWNAGAISCTSSITIYVTVMIAWIIMRARLRMGAKVLGHGLRQALVVIVESAAIYTIWNLFFFIAGLGFKSEIALALLDSIPAVYGISVMLINVRVGLGWARNDEHHGVAVSVCRENGREGNRPGSYGRGGIYVSTVVFTEPSGGTYAQSSEDVELGDTRSVVSSITAPEKAFTV